MAKPAPITPTEELYDITHIYVSCPKWFREVANRKARLAGKSSISSYLRDLVIETWKKQENTTETEILSLLGRET